MNKKLFLIPLAAFALASCSNDGPEVTQTPQLEADADGNVYLAFGLVNATGMTTRDGETTEPVAGNYEAGEGAENDVQSVRFFFFDDKDNVAYVNYNNVPSQYVYWYDYDIENGTTDVDPIDPSTSTEKIINATIVLQSKNLSADNFPTKVIAVVNPPANLGTGLTTLAQFKDLAAGYNVSATSGFLMSNSVYYANGVQDATAIPGGFYPTANEALEHPVELYVERVAAKVRLGLGDLEPVSGLTFKTGVTYENKDIFVDFLGWNVTTTASKTYLVKNFGERWDDEYFKWPVSIPVYRRSFWAMNPAGLSFNYTTFNTGTEAANKVQGFGTDNKNNYTYLYENAGAPITGLDPILGERSQVIIAAQLKTQGENGLAPLDLAEYALMKCNKADLNKVMYNALNTKILKADNTEIDPAFDIIFKTPFDLNGVNGIDWNEPGRYNVYAQLKEGEVYHTEDGKDNDKINEALIATVGPAKIWNSGYTYFYLDIEHINTGDQAKVNAAGNIIGYYGVVRNHVYDIKLDALIGLGTPVYDPTETIIPEKPGNDYGAVAAQINILSWKIVNQNANLEW